MFSRHTSQAVRDIRVVQEYQDELEEFHFTGNTGGRVDVAAFKLLLVKAAPYFANLKKVEQELVIVQMAFVFYFENMHYWARFNKQQYVTSYYKRVKNICFGNPQRQEKTQGAARKLKDGVK